MHDSIGNKGSYWPGLAPYFLSSKGATSLKRFLLLPCFTSADPSLRHHSLSFPASQRRQPYSRIFSSTPQVQQLSPQPFITSGFEFAGLHLHSHHLRVPRRPRARQPFSGHPFFRRVRSFRSCFFSVVMVFYRSSSILEQC